MNQQPHAIWASPYVSLHGPPLAALFGLDQAVSLVEAFGFACGVDQFDRDLPRVAVMGEHAGQVCRFAIAVARDDSLIASPVRRGGSAKRTRWRRRVLAEVADRRQ